MIFTWAVRALMACLVEGVAAALSSSSGGGWRRDPLVLSCLELEQAMQVNIFTTKKPKKGRKFMWPENQKVGRNGDMARR